MTRPTYQQYHTDLPLTNVSIAYTPGEYIWDAVFPGVRVNKLSGKFYIYNKGDWLRSESAVRAPGTRATRVEGFELSTSPYGCVEISLAAGVPDEDVDNSDDPLRPMEDKTRYLTEKVFLKMEKDVADIAFGNSNWSTSSTPTTLWGNDTSDPLGDLETATCSIRLSIGKRNLRGVAGYETWTKLRNHPDVVDRIKYTSSPTSPAIVTQNAVAALADLDALVVGAAIENTAAKGAADSISPVWGKHFLVYYRPAGPSLYTPSAGYVFTYQERKIERFREDQEKQFVLTISWNYVTKLVAADGGYLLKSVVS